MKKTLLVSIALTFTLLCTACANEQADGGIDVQSTGASSTIAESGATPSENTDDNHADVTETTNPNMDTNDLGDNSTATLYITLDRGQSFVEVPVALEDNLPADYTETELAYFLIEEIANTTGWNLDLAEDITSGKGGFGICFAGTSSLFVGPPEPQVDEFFVYDAYGLSEAILDSVKYTLQYNFVDATLGDSSSLDIYFYGENDTDLTLDNINGYVPMTEPYTDIYFL
ncbi:MAG: hypothetical protein R3Y06_04585 [Faecalibacterium sp.]